MKARFGFLTAALMCHGLAAQPPAPVPAPERPKLVLFVVVDQMRHDYLLRFRKGFQGGLKRMLEESADFSEARHAHAVSTTGPGHAALATGTHPGRNGIIDNSWFDRAAGKVVNCVEDPDSPPVEGSGPGRSPRNLLRSGLADWIKEADPQSRVFSASRKDRGAILPAGLRADAAYWYDSDSGRFVTSLHYLKSLPDWLREFNSREAPDSFFGRPWEALPADGPEALLPDAQIGEVDEGAFPRRLPMALGSATFSPDADFYGDFGSSPYMDEHLERLAETLVVHESLGDDDHPDFLALSFSALDSVGHSSGPNSPQVLDSVLRLDRALGRLFEFLDDRIGRGRYLVALSSDHGVMTVPEYRGPGADGPGRRFDQSDVLCFQRAGLRLKEDWGDAEWFLHGLYFNDETLGRRDRRRSEAEAKMASLLKECPAVAEVWTRSELESDREGEFLSKYRRSFHGQRSPDLMVQLRESVISVSGHGTTHGSPYDYDVHVPFLIWGPGVAARQIATPVATVDLAPTLAELLGVGTPEDLDGVSRAALLKQPAAADWRLSERAASVREPRP